MSAVTIGAAVAYERLRGETVVTIEACEQAVQAVYELWERKCMFCPEPDAHETVSEFALPNAAIDRRTEAGL